MLVLTRRINESLVINDNIIITVLGMEGDKVKLGIVAPKEIAILRQELYQAIKAQEQLQEKLASGPEPDTFADLRALLSEEAEKEEQKEEKNQKSAE